MDGDLRGIWVRGGGGGVEGIVGHIPRSVQSPLGMSVSTERVVSTDRDSACVCLDQRSPQAFSHTHSGVPRA